MGEHTETLPDEAYVPCVEEAEDDEELNAMNEGLADADKVRWYRLRSSRSIWAYHVAT